MLKKLAKKEIKGYQKKLLRSNSQDSLVLRRRSKKFYPRGKNPRRYLVVLLFFLQNALSGMSRCELLAIPVTSSKVNSVNNFLKILKLNYFMINLLFASFFFATGFSTFFLFCIMKKIGPSNSVKLAVLLMFTGFCLKTLFVQSIYLLVLGQFLAGVSTVLLKNVQEELVFDWFGRKEVGIILLNWLEGLLG